MRCRSSSSPSWSPPGWSPSPWRSARAGPMTRSVAPGCRMTARPRSRRMTQPTSRACSPPPTPAGRRADATRSPSPTSRHRPTTRYAPRSGPSSSPATRAGSHAGWSLWTSRPRSSGGYPARTGSLPPMPALRRFDVDEILTRPGTYFNPETEIVVVIDDSAHVDLELIEDEEDDVAEWILLGDDPAIDEHKRDELVETFATRRARSATPQHPDADEVEEEAELEPDPDQDY